MTDAEQLQANETVVRLLGRREHSALELRQKLKQRGFSQHVIQNAIKTAQEHQWQSDQRFTEVWVRQALQKGDGPQKIQAAAHHKGIGTDLLQQALNAEQPDWFDMCFQRLLRKFGEQPPKDRKTRDKWMRHLLQRGFTFEQVKYALEQQQQLVAD